MSHSPNWGGERSTSSTEGITSAGVAVGDFDSDGDLDVAVSNQYTADVSVLLGNGDGTFDDPMALNMGAWPQEVAIADFDGDGDLDLASPDTGNPYLSCGLIRLRHNSDQNAGAAHLYQPTDGGWSEPVQLVLGNGLASGDRFGSSVAIEVVEDGAGKIVGGTIVVGAKGSDDAAHDGGSVHIFTYSSGAGWTWRTELLPASLDHRAEFGGRGASAVSGNTVVVGAHCQGNSGDAYVYDIENGERQWLADSLSLPATPCSERVLPSRATLSWWAPRTPGASMSSTSLTSSTSSRSARPPCRSARTTATWAGPWPSRTTRDHCGQQHVGNLALVRWARSYRPRPAR